MDRLQVAHRALFKFIKVHNDKHPEVRELSKLDDTPVTENDMNPQQGGDTWFCSVRHRHIPSNRIIHEFLYRIKDDELETEHFECKPS